MDANHPDGIADTSEDRIHGVTLEREERIRAREAEMERISAQDELGTQDGREQRTREVVSEQCGRDEPAPAERTDPREKLTQDELAEVNEQAMRISDEVQGGWSRAVVAKQLSLVDVQPLVEVRDRENEVDLARTLIHEYTHALLHFDVDDDTERAKREVEAEAVAYVVGRYFGLDTSRKAKAGPCLYSM